MNDNPPTAYRYVLDDLSSNIMPVEPPASYPAVCAPVQPGRRLGFDPIIVLVITPFEGS